MIDYIQLFPVNLKSLRIAYDLSLAEMAGILGLKNRAIPYAWENRTNFPLLDNLVNISACFGVSVDWLIGLSDTPYIETTVIESETYCSDVLKAGRYQVTKYSDWDMWNILLSQRFPQYMEPEARNEYYSLAVRANISVLMQLVTIPSMYWQFYYAQNGFKKRGVMAKVRETLHIPDTVALKEPNQKEKERSEHLTKLLQLRFCDGEYIPNTMPAYDIEAAYRNRRQDSRTK